VFYFSPPAPRELFPHPRQPFTRVQKPSCTLLPDSEGGFISAQTTVETFGLFGIKTGDRLETLSVVISEAGDNRTQVVLQRTEGSAELSQRVRQQLDAKFNRA
jgi:uncharacterized protein YaaQ